LYPKYKIKLDFGVENPDILFDNKNKKIRLGIFKENFQGLWKIKE
jgi:hypothetical protein